jgi:hypothetical protein
VIRGREALRTYFEGLGQVWAEMANDVAYLWEMREGVAFRVRRFFDRDQARLAALAG